MRSIVLSLCLALTAVSSFAQETRYRLERVIVEGSKLDEDMIRGEARLDEEKTYTEDDFRQAVYRIRRLPFVTDAAYRIEPGVTGGGTTLVIRIVDTMPVYYIANGGAQRAEDGDTELTGDALLGWRFLLGNLGMVEAAAQKSEADEGFIAGMAYRAYNIYGTGGYAAAAFGQRFQTDPRRYSPSYVLTGGYPLTQRQTVTASWTKTGTRLARELDPDGDDGGDDEEEAADDNVTLTDRENFQFVELLWWYETIDDPIFTTRGVQLSAGPRWSVFDFSKEIYDEGEQAVISRNSDATTFGFGLDGSAYRPLSQRNSLFLRGDGVVSRINQTDLQSFDGQASAGLIHNFHSAAENVIHPFRARLEIGGGYGGTVRRPKEGDEIRETSAFGEVAFVMRHRWGSLRLFALYDAD